MKWINKEVKIGAIFLVCVALLYVGVNFLKGSNVFSRYKTYYTIVGNAGGISSSSVITTNGYQVGTVNRVEYDYACPNRIVLTLRVKEALNVPKGSRVFLVNSLLDGVGVDLRLSQNVDFYADGDTLPSGISSGLTEQIENVMLPQINTLVPKVDSLVSALTTLASNPALTNSLAHVESISQKLDKTADALNSLFYRELPLLVESLQGTSNNLNEITSGLSSIDYANTMERVDSIVNNIHVLSASLVDERNSIGRLLNDTLLYENLNNICGNANMLIEDVKANPSRYINISVFGKKN